MGLSAHWMVGSAAREEGMVAAQLVVGTSSLSGPVVPTERMALECGGKRRHSTATLPLGSVPVSKS